MSNFKKPYLGIFIAGMIAFGAGLLTAVTLHLPPFSADAAEESLSPGDPRLLSQAFVKVVKDVGPAVVSLDVTMVQKENVSNEMPEFFFGPPDFFGPPNDSTPFGMPKGKPKTREFNMMASGSGVIVSSDGYILTNNHMVEGAKRIRVKLMDKREFDARVIGTDKMTEVAVIKIDGKDLPYARLGDSDKLEVGEWVLAIGNPFQFFNTVTSGIVSAKGRHMGLTFYEDYIQTDAAINRGNSGGPLVNLDGEVVGINTAIWSSTGEYAGIGFAIPINMAKTVMDQLVKTGEVTRAWLGVEMQPLTPDLAKSLGVSSSEGSLVTKVVANSPAEKSGIKQGDIITAVDGEAMPDSGTLQKKISNSTVGSQVTVSVIRDGSSRDIRVTLEKLPKDLANLGESESESNHNDSGKEWGFTVEQLDANAAERMGLPRDMAGIVVTSVDAGGIAMTSGLRQWDVILQVDKQPVASVSEFKQKIAGKDQVLLLVKSGNNNRYIVLKK
jgi:serine protease Do